MISVTNPTLLDATTADNTKKMNLFDSPPLLVALSDDSDEESQSSGGSNRSNDSSICSNDDGDVSGGRTCRKSALSSRGEDGSPARRKKESVRFTDQVRIVEIDGQYEELKNQIWIQKGEYYLITLERKQTASMFRESLKGFSTVQLDESQHCIRGLESSVCPASRLQKHARRANVVQNVLREQEKQRQLYQLYLPNQHEQQFHHEQQCHRDHHSNTQQQRQQPVRETIRDPESIRQCSLQTTTPALIQAYERAAMDALHVERQYAEDRARIQDELEQRQRAAAEARTTKNPYAFLPYPSPPSSPSPAASPATSPTSSTEDRPGRSRRQQQQQQEDDTPPSPPSSAFSSLSPSSFFSAGAGSWSQRFMWPDITATIAPAAVATTTTVASANGKYDYNHVRVR